MPDQTPAHPLAARPHPRPSPPGPTLPSSPHSGAAPRGLCPACGQTHAFAGYLKVVPECTNCGAPLGAVRADDAPPYFTIFIVGHILVGILYEVEIAYHHPPLWLHAAIFIPLALVLTLGLLRPIKGATLGLMLRLGMVKTDGS